jgi:predicted nucleotidyltransferase component of viral defense system
MEKQLAEELAKSLKISINQIISREYWGMVILREISQSRLADFLVFAGGTALRLVYNSPRFSDDLDFYLKKICLFRFFKSQSPLSPKSII